VNRTGFDVGVVAAYDLQVAHDWSAAKSAEQAFLQARQAAALTSSTAPSRFEGAKWAGQVITWSIADSSGTASSPFSGYIGAQYQSLIEQAFATWAAASGLTFEEVPDSTQSDIRIGWGDFNTASSGIVGFTSSNAQNEQIQPGAIIRLEDPSETPLVLGSGGEATYSGTQAELYQVLLHEIGHALGLADDSNPNSVMYYESTSSNRTLDQTDINGIQSLYNFSSPPTSQTSQTAGPGTTAHDLNRFIQAMATFHADTGASDSDMHLSHLMSQHSHPMAPPAH
jgi:predicted Zn-dependent protease